MERTNTAAARAQFLFNVTGRYINMYTYTRTLKSVSLQFLQWIGMLTSLYFACINYLCLLCALLVIRKATEKSKLLTINDGRWSLHLFSVSLAARLADSKKPVCWVSWRRSQYFGLQLKAFVKKIVMWLRMNSGSLAPPKMQSPMTPFMYVY